MSNEGLNPEAAQNFDSAELENKFLSAIGFVGPSKAKKPDSQIKPEPSPHPSQPGHNGNINESPQDGAQPRGTPADQSRNPTRNRRRGQQTPARNEPQGLTNTYWDAQRIAKGIIKLPANYKPAAREGWNDSTEWSYHPSGTISGRLDIPARSQNGGNQEMPSEAFWRAAAPQAYVKDTQSFRAENPTADSEPRAQPTKTTQTDHPETNQPVLPTNLDLRFGVPKTPELRSDSSQHVSVSCNGTESSDMGLQRGSVPKWSSPRGGGGRGGRGGGRGGAQGGGPRDDGQRPPRLDEIEPDLSIYRIPRPDQNYSGSSYSLPSLGSGFNVSDTGAEPRHVEGTDADIRNTIGLKPSIYKAPALDNTWIKYNWADPRGRDADETFEQESYLGSFINAWAKGIPGSVVTSFDQAVDAHWRYDIDTITGRFLPPATQPETMFDSTPLDSNMDWRRRNWTSTLLRKQYNTRRNGRFGEKKPPPLPNHVEYEEPEGVVIDEPVVERPEFHRYVPRISSFLRPAEKYDMEAVRAIYNWEVDNGLQALDSQPLSAEEFENILSTTQQLRMPFIVAVRGSARNLGLTEGNLSFSVFQQIPFYGEQSRGEILGFAFLSVWQPGLGGSATGSSRATAKMNVFVHPDHRRKKIGFSLLDMLLTTVSDCFSSETAYDFIDPDNSPVYRKGPDRQRQHFKVYLSYRVRHKLRSDGNKELEAKQKSYDNDLVWAKKLVEDKLNFTEVVRYEAVHRSAKGRGSEPVCWLDEVVFEHSCSFGGPTAVEAGY